ncbi:hypothetical protein [Curtobacterium herbarum]|uniref:hypothetical protein n=1 Tax=Curtobacterium herbarum TaxID=150122 RepID=UPI001C8DC2B7|nr:hypothetical protein [Curtobacterium herbarum]MBY0175145.1 hypothetical protein [Curtobacterium herbarum]
MTPRPVILGAAAIIGTCLLAPSFLPSPSFAAAAPVSAASQRSDVQDHDDAWHVDTADEAQVEVHDGVVTFTGTATTGTVTVTTRGATVTAPVRDGKWAADVPARIGAAISARFDLRATDGGPVTATAQRQVSTIAQTTPVAGKWGFDFAPDQAVTAEDGKITLTGTAPDGTVAVKGTYGDALASTTTTDGRWSVEVPVRSTGLTHLHFTLTVDGKQIRNDYRRVDVTVPADSAFAVDTPNRSDVELHDGSVRFTGTATTGEVTVAGLGGTTTVPVEDGKWTADLPARLGTTFDVTFQLRASHGGLVTNTVKRQVTTVAEVTPVAGKWGFDFAQGQEVTAEDGKVTLTGTAPDGTVDVTSHNGTPIASTEARDGRWSVEVPVAATGPTTLRFLLTVDGKQVRSDYRYVDVTVPADSAFAVDTPNRSEVELHDGSVRFTGTATTGEVTVAGLGATTTVPVENGTWTADLPARLGYTFDVTFQLRHTHGGPVTNTVKRQVTTVAETTPVAGKWGFDFAQGEKVTAKDGKITLTGTAPDGTVTTKDLSGDTVATTEARDGRWSVEVPVRSAGGLTLRFALTVDGQQVRKDERTVDVTVPADSAFAVDTPNRSDVELHDGTATFTGTATAGQVTVAGLGATTTVPVEDGKWTADLPARVGYTFDVTFQLRATEGGPVTNTVKRQVTTVAETAPVAGKWGLDVTEGQVFEAHDGKVTLTGTAPDGTVTVRNGNREDVVQTEAHDGKWSVDYPVSEYGHQSLTFLLTVDGQQVRRESRTIQITEQRGPVDAAWGIDVADRGTVTVDDGTTTLTGTATKGEVTIVNRYYHSTQTVPVVDGRWSATEYVPYLGTDKMTFDFVLREAPGAFKSAEETRTFAVPESEIVDFTLDPETPQIVDGLAQLSGTSEAGEIVITERNKPGEVARFTVGKGAWKQGVPLAAGRHAITIKYISDRPNVSSTSRNVLLSVVE